MAIRSMVLVAVLWVVSLFAVGAVVRAQAINKFPVPRVLSGADFGIRIESQRDGVLIGPLVVRVNGEWVEAQAGSGLQVHPAH